MKYQERVTELERRFEAAGHPEIIDESCACGHWRSEHMDIFDVGHGGCIHPKCTCVKFAWSAFILRPEAKK